MELSKDLREFVELLNSRKISVFKLLRTADLGEGNSCVCVSSGSWRSRRLRQPLRQIARAMHEAFGKKPGGVVSVEKQVSFKWRSQPE